MKSLTILLSMVLASAFAAEIQEFVLSTTKFAGAVYDEILADNTDNILVSPFSIETVLALTQSGANGITGEEIRTTLYLPDTKEKTEVIIKEVLPTFKNQDYKLHTANKVYVEDNFEIKKDFKKIATDVYQASFENIEFGESTAVEKINKWVEDETENKIQHLLQKSDVDGSTKAVLINALYFQGNWSVPFQPALTQKLVFYTPNDNTLETEMMYQEEEQVYNFYESPELDAKFLELSFQGQNASMTIILPNQKEGIGFLEKQMKSPISTTPKYTPEYVEVSMPKFKIESTIDFGGILEKMGVQAAFDPARADFSGIAGNPGDLIINKITQKTYIDVNESGVEAAAASAVVVGPTDAMPPENTKKFIVDHPFIFYIKVNDIILFEGRVLEPKY